MRVLAVHSSNLPTYALETPTGDPPCLAINRTITAKRPD
jgi:hypothetical protein